MQRALDLAARTDGRVYPNPYVGAVVVRDGRIIGEGWHARAGGPHAERVALEGLSDEATAGATLYVTLEPCNHQGKTPACAPYLVARQLKRIVVAVKDPHHIVQGKGIRHLTAAGVPVTVGVLQDRAARQNRRFFTFHQKKRPYVVLKWAQTLDNVIGVPHKRLFISNETVRYLVHQWRTREHALMITDHTAIIDNARLTVRHWKGFQPIRIILRTRPNRPLPPALARESTGCVHLPVSETKSTDKTVNPKDKKTVVKHILQSLYARNILSVMIEGGASLLQSFIDADCWDEARVITAPFVAGKGIRAPLLNGQFVRQFSLADDLITIFKHPQNTFL